MSSWNFIPTITSHAKSFLPAKKKLSFALMQLKSSRPDLSPISHPADIEVQASTGGDGQAFCRRVSKETVTVLHILAFIEMFSLFLLRSSVL